MQHAVKQLFDLTAYTQSPGRVNVNPVESSTEGQLSDLGMCKESEVHPLLDVMTV